MLSDEEREALRNFKSEYETCDHYSSDLIIELDDAEIILNLIEKQQKEIERTNEILIWKQKHEEQLQKEIEELKDTRSIFNMGRRSYRNEIEDKIKAKIEEVDYKMIAHQDVRLAVKEALNSLLEKE